MTHILFILMRNDIASMNPGKAIAQGTHASNAFVKKVEAFTQIYNTKSKHTDIEDATINGFREWEYSTPQGFGTVLVLEGRMSEFKPIINTFQALGYVADVITDPTYPIMDGEIVHYVNMETCAYVFVPNKEADDTAAMLLRRFSLHK